MSPCVSSQMLSFMRAQYTLFQQGFHILDEIDPYMKKLATQVRIDSNIQKLHTQCVVRAQTKESNMCTNTSTSHFKQNFISISPRCPGFFSQSVIGSNVNPHHPLPQIVIFLVTERHSGLLHTDVVHFLFVDLIAYWSNNQSKRRANKYLCVCIALAPSVSVCFSDSAPTFTLPASLTLLLCPVQLDQLVIDSAVEKREMEHKHALIQQRVRQQHHRFYTNSLLFLLLLLRLSFPPPASTCSSYTTESLSGTFAFRSKCNVKKVNEKNREKNKSPLKMSRFTLAECRTTIWPYRGESVRTKKMCSDFGVIWMET